jgi:hypothetical protein
MSDNTLQSYVPALKELLEVFDRTSSTNELEAAVRAFKEAQEQAKLATRSPLEEAFNAFEAAYEAKDIAWGSVRLKEVLICLRDLQYSRKDIAFALNIEQLTVDRWEDGASKGMKPDTFADFKVFILDVLNGKSRRAISVCDTGFVTWRQMVNSQMASRRIWYIASSKFIGDRSIAFRDAARGIFVPRPTLEPPTMVYIYPPGSETESSLKEWTPALPHQELCGTIIGIEDSTLPWFMPGMRAIMLEKTNRIPGRPQQLEGYVRVRVADENKLRLLNALDPIEEDTPHTPWLQVHRETVDRWHRYLEEGRYLERVQDIQQKQSGSFAVIYTRASMEDGVRQLTITRQEPA